MLIINWMIWHDNLLIVNPKFNHLKWFESFPLDSNWYFEIVLYQFFFFWIQLDSYAIIFNAVAGRDYDMIMTLLRWVHFYRKL